MKKKIRYAVVGLGHIAQVAILPAFKNAKSNSELTALVSGDKKKLNELGKKYKVKNLFSYDEYEEMLSQGLVDAVFICTPNVMHNEFAIMAAKYKVHVLTEKPMATTEEACMSMLKAAEENDIKLMVAYRLHFDPANLEAVELIKKKKLGEPRLFNSTFTMRLSDRGNIRLQSELGGGPLFDIGIYCLNAARYLFQDEPEEVFAMSATGEDSKFKEVEEMMSVMMRFPKERLANFVISFNGEACADFDIVGTKGRLRLESAYEYAEKMTMTIVKDDKKQVRQFKKRDQFGPELVYFSDCVLKNKKPEPSAEEGLLDVLVINAIYESIQKGKPVKVGAPKKASRPNTRQKISRPAHRREPELVHARGG